MLELTPTLKCLVNFHVFRLKFASVDFHFTYHVIYNITNLHSKRGVNNQIKPFSNNHFR